MLTKAVIVLLSVQLIVARPQFITFKDGKIGVNFGGYHAEAGLGGLLTGNAAHGGLSASAGTPFGQRAGAGVGGSVDGGRTAGGAYAGASSGYGAGASAAIGGSTDSQGGFAAGGKHAEAHSGGISKSVVKLYDAPAQALVPQQVEAEAQPHLDTRIDNEVVVKKTVIKKKYVPEVAKPVAQEKPVEAAQAPTVNNEAHPVAQGPAVAPFDYRKFFDFSFFGNLGSAFGGNPQGFQPAQQAVNQQHAPGRLIQYTVQKQFAPVQYTPVEKPQPAMEEAAQAEVSGNTQTAGIQKTVYVAPFAPVVYKKHHLRRFLHPKRVQVVKTVQIQ